MVLGAMDQVAESLGPWAAFIVNLGFVGWLAWHHTAKAIPKLVADFRADIQQERLEFAKMLDKVTTVNEARLALVTATYETKMAVVTATFEREQTADRQHCVEQLKLTNQQWREIWTAGFKHGKEQTHPA